MSLWSSTSSFCYRSRASSFLDDDTLSLITRACVIMHNMIIEDERDEEDDFNYDVVGENVKISHDSTWI